MGEHGANFDNSGSIYDDSDEGSGVVRIASVAALGGFLFGYDSAVINGANARWNWASPWRPRCSAPPPARCSPAGWPITSAGCR